MRNTRNTPNKRWSVVRRTTGSVVRSFESREAARAYKRNARGNLGLFDNILQTAAR